jgi:hypothetical protein
MTRHLLLAVTFYVITLGGLFAYNSAPEQLTESERLAIKREMKEEYRAAIRDKIERFRTGRLSDEEKAEMAAAQEKFARVIEQAMKEVTTEVDKAFLETADNENEVDLMVGRNAVDECLEYMENDDAYGKCLDQFYQ